MTYAESEYKRLNRDYMREYRARIKDGEWTPTQRPRPRLSLRRRVAKALRGKVSYA